MNLFGHHHAADPTLAERAGLLVHAVPVPIWVAVLGVLAAIATPSVQHLFDRRRDRADRARASARVRTDLLVRVRAHLALLAAAAERGAIDVERWHRALDGMAARAREAEVIEALGPAYAAVVAPVHAETLACEAALARAHDGDVPGPSGATLRAIAAAYDPALRILGAPHAQKALAQQLG